MQRDEVQTLWRTAAIMLGMALPAMMFGRAVTSGLIILGIICGLMATKDTSIRSSVRMMRESAIAKTLVLFVLALLLSAAFSIDPVYSFRHAGQTTLVLGGAALLFIVFREMPSRYMNLTMRTLAMTTLVAIILALFDAFVYDPRLSAALHGKRVMEADRLHYMSSILSVILPFQWAWFMRMNRESDAAARYVAIPFTLLGLVTVFVCGGRAGWIAVVIAGALFLMLGTRYHGIVLRTRHWLMGILLLLMAPLLYILSLGMASFEQRVQSVRDYHFGERLMQIWETALSHIWDNPVTGIGVDAFRELPEVSKGALKMQSPHNFLLQLGLETGVIGLFVGLMITVLVLKRFLRYAQGDLYGLAGFCAMVAFMTVSLFDHSIFQPWWLTFGVFSAVLATRIGWSYPVKK